MQTAKIYDFLQETILSLGLDGVSPNEIKRPNVAFNADDKPLFFEIYVGDDAPQTDTETSVISRRVASIVIVGKLGEGTERVERIARGVVDVFATYNPRRFQGFATVERVFVSPLLCGGGRAATRSTCCVVGVRSSAAGIYDGRVKASVFIDLEISTGAFNG